MTFIFKSLFSVLFLMAIFRYGQGQDYFNYEYIYGYIDTITRESLWGLFMFPDIGYGFLNYLFILLDLPYELFMGAFTSITMIMFYLFLKKTCNCSMVALLIFYSIIFMIYPMSASRQGFCMAFFLSIMYPLLEKGNFKKYYLYLFFASTIHLSSIVLGILPIFYKVKITNKLLLMLFFVSFVFVFLKINLFSYIPLSFIQTRMVTYMEEASSNQILAKIVRFMIVFPLLFIPSSVQKESNVIVMNRILLVVGFFVYGLTSFSELMSSRLWGYFLGFECILLSKLSTKLYLFKHKQLLLIYYVLIVGVLWIKDVNVALEQGKYKNCNIVSYPYISIFEGKEELEFYRTDKGYVNN